MLRYGQFVRLKTPQTIKIISRWCNKVERLKKKYKFKIEEMPESMYGREYFKPYKNKYDIYVFTAPVGTIGFLSFGLVLNTESKFKIYLPELDSFSEVGADDFDLEVTSENVTRFSDAHKKFLLKKHKVDNLKTIERMVDLQEMVLKK